MGLVLERLRNFDRRWKCKRWKKKTCTLPVIIFWNFIKFYYRFQSPQVKHNLISSITNFVYELPNELANDLRFKISLNLQILKVLMFDWRRSFLHLLPSRNKALAIKSKKYAKIDSEVFCSCLILVKIFILFKIFRAGL